MSSIALQIVPWVVPFTPATAALVWRYRCKGQALDQRGRRALLAGIACSVLALAIVAVAKLSGVHCLTLLALALSYVPSLTMLGIAHLRRRFHNAATGDLQGVGEHAVVASLMTHVTAGIILAVVDFDVINHLTQANGEIVDDSAETLIIIVSASCYLLTCWLQLTGDLIKAGLSRI